MAWLVKNGSVGCGEVIITHLAIGQFHSTWPGGNSGRVHLLASQLLNAAAESTDIPPVSFVRYRLHGRDRDSCGFTSAKRGEKYCEPRSNRKPSSSTKNAFCASKARRHSRTVPQSWKPVVCRAWNGMPSRIMAPITSDR